jgi:hypothetical protein
VPPSFGSSGFTGSARVRASPFVVLGGSGTHGQKFSTRIIAASGDVTLGLDFNTDGVAEISLSSFISFEQSFRPERDAGHQDRT